MAFHPIASFCRLRQKLTALSQAGRNRCTERYHCFSAKVIRCDETVHRPSGNAPPDRVANKYCIIGIPVVHCGFGQFNCPLGWIFMLHINPAAVNRPIQIGGSIGNCRNQLKEVGIQCFRDGFRYRFGTAGSGVINNQCIATLAGSRMIVFFPLSCSCAEWQPFVREWYFHQDQRGFRYCHS